MEHSPWHSVALAGVIASSINLQFYIAKETKRKWGSEREQRWVIKEQS